MAKKTDWKKIIGAHHFPAWSPSALRDWEVGCPRKAVLDRRVRLCNICFKGSVRKPRGEPVSRCDQCGARPPPPGEPLQRGTVIHSAAEHYIQKLRGQARPKVPETGAVYLGSGAVKLAGKGFLDGSWYPYDLKPISKLLDELRVGFAKGKVKCEVEVAVTRTWGLTDWFSSDVYARFKMDIIHETQPKHIRVRDWKTGKPHPDEYDDQLAGYAVAALSAGLGDSVTSSLVFTDSALVVERPAGSLARSGLRKEQKRWEARAQKMLDDRTFKPRPGHSCFWCPFAKRKGGPCEHGT